MTFLDDSYRNMAECKHCLLKCKECGAEANIHSWAAPIVGRLEDEIARLKAELNSLRLAGAINKWMSEPEEGEG